DLEALRIYAQSLNNAGICYNELGEFDRAVDLQRRAVRIHEQHGLTNSFEQALGELGRTYLTHDDPAQALPPLRRAFEVARAAHINDDAAVWAGSIAQAYIDLGRWDEAAGFNDQAVQMREAAGAGRVMWNTLNAATIAAGRGRADEAFKRYEEAITASAEEPVVRWQATAGLARVALAQGQRDRARGYFERALSIIEQTRSTLIRADYKLSYFYSLIRVYREYVDSLIGDGHIEQALEVADSSRARVLAE